LSHLVTLARLLQQSVQVLAVAFLLTQSCYDGFELLIVETPCVFLGGLYQAEQGIAERLKILGHGKLPWNWIDPEKALPWIEQKTGLALAASQKQAIRLALVAKVLVITGGTGVGKTTIINSILRILAAMRQKSLRRLKVRSMKLRSRYRRLS
jgi:exodeoxyribonuclease V alpha subunit